MVTETIIVGLPTVTVEHFCQKFEAQKYGSDESCTISKLK